MIVDHSNPGTHFLKLDSPERLSQDVPSWLPVLTCLTSIFPSSALSLTKWYLTWMCLLRPLSTGFLIKAIVDWLSTIREGITTLSLSNSPSKRLNQSTWHAPFVAATYSAYFVDCHVTGLSLRKKNTLEVFFLLSTSPAKSLSVKPTRVVFPLPSSEFPSSQYQPHNTKCV
jgi:hypothetical protein